MFKSRQEEDMEYFMFGGLDDPEYSVHSIPAGSSDTDIARILWSLSNGNILLGYIENDAIYYFENIGVEIYFDLCKETVFMVYPSFYENIPTSFMLLRFLQHRCSKAIYVSDDVSLSIRKTEKTYELCDELDILWGDSRWFVQTIGAMHSGKDVKYDKETLFEFLMSEYYQAFGKEVPVCYEMFELFKESIMRDELFLEVEKILI